MKIRAFKDVSAKCYNQWPFHMTVKDGSMVLRDHEIRAEVAACTGEFESWMEAYALAPLTKFLGLHSGASLRMANGWLTAQYPDGFKATINLFTYMTSTSGAHQFPVKEATMSLEFTLPAFRTVGYVSKDDLRPAMTCVRVEKGKEVATNGHILITAPNDYNGEYPFLLTGDLLKRLRAAGAKTATITAAGQNEKQTQYDWVYLTTDNGIEVYHNVAERYPDYKGAFQTTAPTLEIPVRRADLRRLLNSCLDSKMLQYRPVVFNLGAGKGFSESKMTISTDSYKVEQSIDFQCADPMKFGVAVTNLKKILNGTKGDVLTLQVWAPNKSIIAETDGATLLVMPVMLTEND